MIRWETDTRFYTASLQYDLFGLCIHCKHGQIAGKKARIYSFPCDDIADARDKLRTLFKRRRDLGYLLFP